MSLLLSALRPRLWRVFGALVLLGSFGLQTSYASAASLTLTVPRAIKLEINPGASATFSKSSASSIGVKTDAAFGYDLSIKVKDGANGNSLVNGSNKLSSISANLSEESYKAVGDDNTWGYLPSKVNSSDNTEFLPGPTTSLTTIEKTSAKNDTDNNYSVTLAAKVDQTVPTGNYTNTFVFTAAANTVSYSITYNLNSGSGGPSPNPQTGTTSNGTIKLDSTAPTREGYEFKGWCTVSTSDENCSGTTYQPGTDYPLQNNSNTITLWAMWKPTVLYMQSWNGCNDLGVEETITLTDSRDNSTYTVAKLKDGKCWMEDNLKLINTTITSEDSDVFEPFIIPDSDINGFNIMDKAFVYLDHTYGAYYSWFAATAGTGLSRLTEGQNASSSICPKNWKLPDTAYNDWIVANYNYLNPPINLTLNGNLSNGEFHNRPSHGHIWNSNASDSGSQGHCFWYYSIFSGVATHDSCNYGDGVGVGVRCITK